MALTAQQKNQIQTLLDEYHGKLRQLRQKQLRIQREYDVTKSKQQQIHLLKKILDT